MTNQFRVLTFSNNLFIVQSKFLWFWISDSEQFSTMHDAKNYITNLKMLAERPKLLDISYID